jgi:hypothetical protein
LPPSRCSQAAVFGGMVLAIVIGTTTLYFALS